MGNPCKLREKRLLYLRAFPSKAELDMAIVPRTIDTSAFSLFFFFILRRVRAAATGAPFRRGRGGL